MRNKVVDEKFASIVDAVCYWLGYQLKIGRHQLIHEASLRYPIADTITSKGTAINRIVLEKLHPIFKSKKIDLVIYNEKVNDPEKELDDQNLTEVYEFKLAKIDTSKFESDEHQRVFDDIVRLAYFNKWGNKNCYFLMCGKYLEFKTYFIGQKSDIKSQNGINVVAKRNIQNKNNNPQLKIDGWKADGLYKDWFGFNLGEEVEKEFKIVDASDKKEWGLKSFQDNYQIRDNLKMTFTDSIKIKTKCLAITPHGLEKNRTHAAGIWKIEMK